MNISGQWIDDGGAISWTSPDGQEIKLNASDTFHGDAQGLHLHRMLSVAEGNPTIRHTQEQNWSRAETPDGWEVRPEKGGPSEVVAMHLRKLILRPDRSVAVGGADLKYAAALARRQQPRLADFLDAEIRKRKYVDRA